MSGHSKWATTKHRKAAQDAKRSALFSKLSRNITVAAKEGGDPNPDNNASLAAAIEKAKGYSLPKDKIKTAIDKAFGSGKDAANYETVVYEGYGPCGVAIYCEALTDNRNRTAADVRAAFTHAGGNLGTSGSVSYMFERKGQIMVPKEVETGDKKHPMGPNGAAADEEEFEMAVIEAGGDDYEDADEEWIVYTQPSDLMAVKKALEPVLAQKTIAKSQEARVSVVAPEAVVETVASSGIDMAEFCIVAGVDLVAGEVEEPQAQVEVAQGDKCPRCWNVRTLCEDGLCQRCHEALEG